MAVKIGHASLGEDSKVSGGSAGDQTGKEVFTRDWYLHSKGWVVLRCNDADKRDKIAEAMEKACANKQIGYDQNQRNTLFNNVKDKGFDTSKTTANVETDCSALVRVCVAYAYGKDVVGNITTSTEPSALVKTGLFTKHTEDKYCKSSDYLMRGDILCTKTKGHTVIVLSNGSKVKKGEMLMSNSSLATLWVPADPSNYYNSRCGSKIEEITIHHMAGRLTAKRCGELFQNPDRNGSSHYGIGYDGTIAQYVDEKYGAWTNSNKAANCRAVTIETANDSTGGNWPVNDITLRSLINLVADIAKRNGLIPLVKGKNLTWHQMYSATACPGPYLLSKIDYIIEEANKIINNGATTTTTPVTITYQAYDGAWLGQITGYDANNSKTGFAGVIGRPMSGIYANASVGNVYYRVHQKGGSWLPEVKNREDYAGNLGKPIDGFMIRSDSTKLTYRAHDKVHGWLSEISGYDINNASTGYAGWTGYDIDAIMIKADPIITIVEPPKTEEPKQETTVSELYRIRLTWADTKSQVGAYKNLDSAIKICQEKTDATGTVYSVFNSKGEAVYIATIKTTVEPEPAPEPEQPKIEVVEPTPTPEVITAVYDLDYPNKVLIVDKTISRTNEDCVKAIKAIKTNNIDFDPEIAKAFFALGAIYSIDPMMAIAQSILETGWFKYVGSAVKPEHHNYCGLGVTSNGITGGIFNTIEDGVNAQYQHLFAYGSKEALPSNVELLDPRFKYVTRGIATHWQQLAGRWAVPGYDKTSYEKPIDAMNAGATYGQKILVIFNKINDTTVSKEEVETYFKTEIKDSNIITPTFIAHKVKVTADALNVRSAPSMDGKINARVRKNEIYTIIEEKNGFGKLKSGAGWILLEYTKKI